MGSVEPLEDPEAALERVRLSFHARLGGERARLASLAEALKSAGRNQALILQDIATFAHRLRGAAATFDVPELSADAKALELAATMTADGLANDREPSFWPTLETLSNRLTVLSGGMPATGTGANNAAGVDPALSGLLDVVLAHRYLTDP